MRCYGGQCWPKQCFIPCRISLSPYDASGTYCMHFPRVGTNQDSRLSLLDPSNSQPLSCASPHRMHAELSIQYGPFVRQPATKRALHTTVFGKICGMSVVPQVGGVGDPIDRVSQTIHFCPFTHPVKATDRRPWILLDWAWPLIKKEGECIQVRARSARLTKCHTVTAE
jgi:hypothetical protein